MVSHTLPLTRALQCVLSESLELHLDGITDYAARSAALHDVCERITRLLATKDLPISNDVSATHRVLIAAALHAATHQLSNELANA